MARVLGCVVTLVIAACGSERARDEPAPALATPTESARTAEPVDVPPEAVCVAPVSAKIDNGACEHDADCVLTNLATDCTACNLDRLYPTRKAGLVERVERCASVPPATTACGSACPVHDTYTGAFYRAQCRAHRCIAWRYHGGG